jgi:beta-lactamase class A
VPLARIAVPVVSVALVAGISLLFIFILDGDRDAGPGSDCPPDGGAEVVLPSSTLVISPSRSATPTLPAPTASLPPTATATPTRTSTPVPSARTRDELQRNLEQAIAAHPVPGRYAFAATDLQTGETVSVNGGRKQLAGCAINLFVLLQATLDLQSGRYAPDKVGLVDRLMSATTWSSNAETARDLYTLVGEGDTLAGVSRVAKLISQDLRLSSTVLDHPPLFGESSLGGGDNWLTANDAVAALAAVWQTDLLSDAWRTYLLGHLAMVKPGLNYLVGSLSGATVSHKNGFFEYSAGFVDNDIGIVQLRTGGRTVAFAVAFLAEEVPTKYADVPLGQQLVRMAFAYFRDAYE